MKFALLALGSVLILLTALSLIRSGRWWIRFADFPRLQIAIALAIIGVGFVPYYDTASLLDAGFGFVLLVSLGYQSYRIWPYTPLAPRQSLDANRTGADSTDAVRLLISNVRMENRRDGDFFSRVRETDPDIILAVETDDWWDGRLRQLDHDYPHSIKQPQDNHYGMHFFSRLALKSGAVRFLLEGDIPSIRAEILLNSGRSITFLGLHPRPPLVDQDTHERDAEILVVGREVSATNSPTIVAGDLNDVAWSDTTQLFQRISGMLDPRRGRGMYASFHADYPLMRWPLDHVFHNDSFTLVAIRCLASIGSDHFPVFIEVRLQPGAEELQDEPEPDRGDLHEAKEQIELGRQESA